MAIEAGYDPDELMQEFADWARAKAARSADWNASWRRWVRREAQFRRWGRTSREERQAKARAVNGALAAQLAARGFRGLPKGRMAP